MAKVIMIQGTMSNVGKSIVTAGLCRIFKQDGYKVAPFKSQNMALNSFITDDGLEMGRAQVMQAEASGISPNIAMNPILLKPTNDIGSQVILNGEILGNMSATEYYRKKESFIPHIMKSFNILNEKYDIIVIEGAGSPAEINLKKNDIVNMGMAKLAKSPVLLVGDIDRGGVFAQLWGTINLLDDDERKYIKAMIINKFRGSRKILESGLDILEKKTEKPIAGVIPYTRLDIDDEDSLSERFLKNKKRELIDIAVIKLPRISNFTDFNVFERFEGVGVNYVDDAGELEKADVIIIPGTKNTIDDLLWIRENGIETKIKQLASKGKPIIGICGGYQMLGDVILDYNEAENKGEFKGIGLLPIATTFEKSKIRTRIKGKFDNISGIFKELKGKEFEGYEIHMGISNIVGKNKNMNILENEKGDGVNIGNIYGTYIHGIFDDENIAKTIISTIMKEKGINPTDIKAFNMKDYKEKQYNLLAETIRENVDMDMIYKILNDGM